MIAILNAQLGNIKSVQNSLNFYQFLMEVISSLDNFDDQFTRLILPGVGEFKFAMSKDKVGKFFPKLKNCLKNIPIWICIGAQILCNFGFEGVK